MFATTKEMVRIFQVVNLPIPDTNLSFIELLNFLVSSTIQFEMITLLHISYLNENKIPLVPIMYAIKK